MTETQTMTPAYEAAHQEAILVDRSDLGMLKFSGESRLDLVHRMSTNKVNGLQSGEGVATILTSDIARIIDRIILYASSDAVYVLTGENHADGVARYLMRFVFFNDDFRVEDLSLTTAIWGVYGAQAGARLAALFGQPVDWPRHHWRQLSLDGQPVYVHRTDPVAGDGYLVMCQMAEKAAVGAALENAGIFPTSADAFEYLRIESGQPRFGRELSLDYIPLEANLWDDVSFSKGCYIGQEIIARMESRGKLARQLRRLRLDEMVEAGSAVATAGGKNAGTITSIADGPQGILALGYIKTSALKASGFRAGSATVTLLDAPS